MCSVFTVHVNTHEIYKQQVQSGARTNKSGGLRCCQEIPSALVAANMAKCK